METMLEFGTKRHAPGVRMLFDMKEVVYDQEWLKRTNNIELYYMYRELSLSKNDALIMKEHGLRYDITVIPPRMLGCEFVKTAGHYHPVVPDTDLTYPEIYEVLSGEAHYLLQKAEGTRITDVILVRAGQGDKVIIPPGYGHLTINASHHVLKMANFVARGFESIYAPIQERGGGAYFILDRGIVRNPRYGEVPEIRRIEPTNIREMGFHKNREMYGLVRKIENLDFLTHPHKYRGLFEEVTG